MVHLFIRRKENFLEINFANRILGNKGNEAWFPGHGGLNQQTRNAKRLRNGLENKIHIRRK